MEPQWTLTPSIYNVPGPRCSHTLTKTDDSAVILIGGGKVDEGTDGFNHYNDVWRWYDGKWTKKTCAGFLFTARRGHTAIYYQKQIIVFGGAGSLDQMEADVDANTFAQSTVPRNDVCVLDVETWTWSVPSIGNTRPSPRRGSTNPFYQHVWSFAIPLTPSPPSSLPGHSATLLGHHMIVVGGDTGEVDFTQLALIWCLNLETWQWSTVTGPW